VLLGLDLGTGSAKALLLNEDGTVAGAGSAPYAVHSPYPGWAQSDPSDWWDAAAAAAREALGVRGREVVSLGLSGQMHGVVLCSPGGAPLRPAVLWADTRSGAQVELYRTLDPDLSRRLANPSVTGMAGPSLLWLRDHEPDAYTSARWALQPKDWLRLRLTGEPAAEPSDASATLLYDLVADGWAWDVVDALGLRSDLLPPLRPSGRAAGELTAEGAAHLGLPVGLPAAAGAADTAAAMLGTGLLLPGSIQMTLGTAGQIVTLLDAPTPDPTLRTHLYRAAMPHRWYAMAAVQNVGLALEWVRGVLGATWDEVDAEALAVPVGAEGLTFLPYLTGERTPHLDPRVRGAWAGLGLHHTRAHLLRAALEGVAYAMREALETLEESGCRQDDLCLAGGGTVEGPWRQMLADVLNRSLTSVPEPAASARGAALLAGVAAGTFASAADIAALASVATPVAAPGAASPLYEDAYRRYRDLYPRLKGYSA